MYQRKTRDIYEIQGLYGDTWETETTEATKKQAKIQLKTYRENVPTIQYRIKKTRERIVQ